MLAFAGLFMTACGPEDNEFAGLTTVTPDETLVIPGFTASAVDPIDFNQIVVSDEMDLQVFTVPETALPDGVELSKAEIVLADGTVMPSTINGEVSGKALSDYVIGQFGNAQVLNDMLFTVYFYATFNGAAVKITAGEVTDQVMPKDFPDYIYERGNNTSWGDGPACPLHCEDKSQGIYVGFMYLNGGFKFMPNDNNWEGDFGQDPNGEDGALVVEGETDCQAAAGFYVVTVDLMNMTYELTPIEFVDIAGNAEGGSWDEGAGIRMEYNVDEGCWEAIVTLTGQFKFRGNGTWGNADGNFGGSLDNIWNGSNDNLVPDDDLTGVPVHVKFFAICNTMSYAEITPAPDPVPGDGDGTDDPADGDGTDDPTEGDGTDDPTGADGDGN